MPLPDRIRDWKPPTERRGPLWKGPEQDGITFSLLSRFLTCRERFRCMVVEGLKPADTFRAAMEYGNLWHVCEEALADGVTDWRKTLVAYAKALAKKYPAQQEEIDKWYNVCKAQFPVYVAYWSKHPDVKDRKPLLQEETFNVPYELPSGRTVRLRGKFDSVDLINGGIWLQENKTKSEVDSVKLARQLTFDLQTMMYLTALTQDTGIEPLEDVKGWNGKGYKVPIKGVRYNVIRRPLSGGRHTIVRHKATAKKPEESKAAYYARLGALIEGEPDYFFCRLTVDVMPTDVLRFRRECLDPLLEQLCDWWDFVRVGDPFRHDGIAPEGDLRAGGGIHWVHPFGVRNIIDEGGSTDLDEYLASGSTVGLRVVDNLFPEL